MDGTQSSIIAIVGLVISVAGSFIAVVNHRRIRSNCCGAPLVLSVDVESTTPPDSLKIKIPSEQRELQKTP
jgi:hypothetical protein